MANSEPQEIIVGLSGASGVAIGVRVLELLKTTRIKSHLVMSKSAELTLSLETDLKADDVRQLADEVHPIGDVGANIASGSHRTMGMLIAPCSIRTMGEVVTGITSTLLTRAADVTLKERRKLVMMVRETPLHLGHLRSMTAATEMGAIIMPPVPAYYAKPETVDDVITQSAARALDLFGIDLPELHRWSGKKG
ncbi:MAG: UbiX family flavin prenyltransferase [Sphingomonadales bacterium]|nr:UbiX family flavin prenyltransferase [Sphingomonadales bacterium]